MISIYQILNIFLIKIKFKIQKIKLTYILPHKIHQYIDSFVKIKKAKTSAQISINEFSKLCPLDRGKNKGVIIKHVKGGIPIKIILKHIWPTDIETLSLKLNWSVIYHTPSQSDQYLFDKLYY